MAVPLGIRKNLAYCFYLIVIFAPFGNFKDLDCDGLRLICSLPDFRRNAGLLRYSPVSRNARKGVRCWYDPVATTNLAEMRQGLALQFNAQPFVRIQDLEGETMVSDVVDNDVEGDLFYARHNIDEFLSSVLGCNSFYASQLIVQALFHHRRSGHEDRY